MDRNGMTLCKVGLVKIQMRYVMWCPKIKHKSKGKQSRWSRIPSFRSDEYDIEKEV